MRLTDFRTLAVCLALTVAVLTSGCVSRQVIKANSTPAIKAEGDLPENQLLDVGIALFDPGIPEDIEETLKKLINPGVRRAEAGYMPYVLKKTLTATGNWGAVRVTPRESSVVDLRVEAQILKSDGEQLELLVRATDAAGRVWLEKEYHDLASRFAYESKAHADEDPFQDIYNSIANDLLQARTSLAPEELARIREITRLRFAADLSPDSFGNHLDTEKDGTYYIRRLPAEQDPMLARVESILQREHMFIDVLDEHYSEFHEEMVQPYNDWRQFSYEEVIALRDLRAAARMRKLMGAAAIIGGAVLDSQSSTRVQGASADALMILGAYTLKSGFDMGKESKMHAEALRELAGSFNAEVEPLVVEVQGKTVTLTGTAEQQYEEWRNLLREIYETETGLPSLSRAPVETAAAPATDGR